MLRHDAFGQQIIFSEISKKELLKIINYPANLVGRHQSGELRFREFGHTRHI